MKSGDKVDQQDTLYITWTWIANRDSMFLVKSPYDMSVWKKTVEQIKGVDAVDLGVTQIVEKEGSFLAATFPEKVPVDTI